MSHIKEGGRLEEAVCFLSANGKNHADAEAFRLPMSEPHFPAVGCGDLAHELEARAVGGPAVCIQLVGLIDRYRGSHCSAALHKEDDLLK